MERGLRGQDVAGRSGAERGRGGTSEGAMTVYLTKDSYPWANRLDGFDNQNRSSIATANILGRVRGQNEHSISVEQAHFGQVPGRKRRPMHELNLSRLGVTMRTIRTSQ